MQYVSFVDLKGKWQLFRGIGADGELISALDDTIPLHDLSAARAPILWVCSQSSGNHVTAIERVKLGDLSREPVPWNRGLVGALASAPDGERAVLLELPSYIGDEPALWLWNGNSWQVVRQQVKSDISSKLAWLDNARIVYESVNRKLTIVDLLSGTTETGLSGCCPAAAMDIREWYALSGGQVMRFPFEQPFSHQPTVLDGFNFGDITTLRVTQDGNVFTWTEPKFGYRSKAFFQERGQRRKRFRLIDDGIGAVLGPFSHL